jgi:hypothetical protein
MKKTMLINVTILIIMLAASAFQTAPQQPEASAWKLLVTIPVGKQQGEIAYLSQPGFGRTQGPEAFTVAPDGAIYVLDSVNQRIYEARGQKSIRAIKLPGASYPMDIAWDNSDLTILDDTNRILRYANDGRMLNETKLPAGMKTEQVYRLDESSGKQKLWVENSREFNSDALPESGDWAEPKNGKGLGSGIAAPDGTRWVAMGGDWTQGIFMTPDGSRKIAIEAYGLLGSARLIGFDRQSNLYILVEDLYDETPDKLGVELTIRKYAPGGKLLGVAKFPQGQSVVPSRRPVEVTSDGSVYAMIAGKQAVSIYAVTLGASYTPKAWRVPLDQGGETNESLQTQPKAFITSLRRVDVFTRAKKMIQAAWIWRSSYDWINADSSLSGLDTKRSALDKAPRPLQLKYLVDGAPATGIPYYWGGFDSLWTKSDWAAGKWSNWNGALSYYRNQTKKGPLVGDPNTTRVSVPSVYRGGAGIDCSGFVAAASGITYATKPGSQGLASQGQDWRGSDSVTVALRRLQPMNFLVTRDHILYYYRRSHDLTGIMTMESTVAGSPQGAKFYTRTWSELQNYTYHRSWWPIAPGDSPDTTWVLTSQGAQTTCYGAGQTIWYKFTVPAGMRNVTLTGISAGDVDLYVYDPSFILQGSSTQSGMTNESVSISAAGTYYAMVHVWIGPGCITWSIAW